MRNPFRRQRRLPGASAEWDESKHVDVGDDHVAVPADQLNPEAVERLSGVQLLASPDGDLAVMVDVAAAEAESVALMDAAEQQIGRALTDAEMMVCTSDAINNTEHWV